MTSEVKVISELLKKDLSRNPDNIGYIHLDTIDKRQVKPAYQEQEPERWTKTIGPC